jgi:AraC family transcriptional activator of pobA
MSQNEPVPVLGIQGFRDGQLAGRAELLFNELTGEKRIDKPHKHDFFMIVLFDRASGVHTIDAVDYAIENRQVHILFPGQMHHWHIQEGCIGYQLMIERVFFEQFSPFFRFSFTNYQNHPVITLSDEGYRLLLYEFIAIREELKAEHSLVQLINARAAVIAALVSREAEEIFQEYKIYQSVPKLAAFNVLIDEFYKEEKQVAFYAERLHISANYLNILCRKHLKTSATGLIHQRVLLEAKRLLRSNEHSVKEVAFILNFSDHAHFSNFFKLQTGVSPSVFRGNE